MESKAPDLIETARADLAAMVAVARRGLDGPLPDNGREFTEAADKFLATLRRISLQIDGLPRESAIVETLPFHGLGNSLTHQVEMFDRSPDANHKSEFAAWKNGELDDYETAWQEKFAEWAKMQPDHWSAPKSPKEWASHFGITPSTFLRWRGNGTIRSKSVSERRVCVHLDDVNKRET